MMRMMMRMGTNKEKSSSIFRKTVDDNVNSNKSVFPQPNSWPVVAHECDYHLLRFIVYNVHYKLYMLQDEVNGRRARKLVVTPTAAQEIRNRGKNDNMKHLFGLVSDLLS